MIIHNLIQGSPEWLAYRAKHRNASDAPAMMGVSPYKTRAQLLRELSTGVVPEVDIATQKRFDNGHRTEARARPLAEQILGEDLYPVTCSLGRMSASFDGLTLDETQGFEHKALNADLRAAFDIIAAADLTSESCRVLPVYHRVQMEQQLHVSGAERILFMASEWTADGELVEERHCWYYPDDVLRGELLAGWAQFERDLAAYVLPEAAEAAPVGKAPDALPALRIEVTGEVTASNLADFKAHALGAIRSVNRTLRTDQDFADAEKAVKWCSDVEQRLKAAKEHALSQTASIDALFRAIDEISAEARTVRLDLDKLVSRRKGEIKEQAVAAAIKALADHVAGLNGELAPMRMQPVVADFAGSIKGLRSVASMQDALDAALARAKIDADAAARLIRANVTAFRAHAEEEHAALFPDLGQLVHKAPDDFVAVLQARIAQHQAAQAERARKEAEAKRMADEAAARAAASAAAATGYSEGQHPQQVLKAEPETADATDRGPAAMPSPRGGAMGAGQAAAAAPAVEQPATLRLGTICERLGITMTADFVADELGVHPARSEKAAKLYTEAQFGAICRELISHVGAMATLYGAEVQE